MNALLTVVGVACLFLVIVMGALGLAGLQLNAAEPVDDEQAVADDEQLVEDLAGGVRPGPGDDPLVCGIAAWRDAERQRLFATLLAAKRAQS